LATRTFTVPDLLDSKGRAIARARVQAWRTDTHALIDETQYTDEYGQCTFTTLPEDVTCVLLAQYGTKGIWLFAPVLSVEEGGTGSSDPDTALENLEIVEEGMLWAIVL